MVIVLVFVGKVVVVRYTSLGHVGVVVVVGERVVVDWWSNLYLLESCGC